jgi:hypothetical protein
MAPSPEASSALLAVADWLLFISLLLVHLAVVMGLLVAACGANVAASRLGPWCVSFGTVIMARLAAVGRLRCRCRSWFGLSGCKRGSSDDQRCKKKAGRDHGGLLG